jgi:hypothetical protein
MQKHPIFTSDAAVCERPVATRDSGKMIGWRECDCDGGPCINFQERDRPDSRPVSKMTGSEP